MKNDETENVGEHLKLGAELGACKSHVQACLYLLKQEDGLELRKGSRNVHNPWRKRQIFPSHSLVFALLFLALFILGFFE